MTEMATEGLNSDDSVEVSVICKALEDIHDLILFYEEFDRYLMKLDVESCCNVFVKCYKLLNSLFGVGFHEQLFLQRFTYIAGNIFKLFSYLYRDEDFLFNSIEQFLGTEPSVDYCCEFNQWDNEEFTHIFDAVVGDPSNDPICFLSSRLFDEFFRKFEITVKVLYYISFRTFLGLRNGNDTAAVELEPGIYKLYTLKDIIYYYNKVGLITYFLDLFEIYCRGYIKFRMTRKVSDLAQHYYRHLNLEVHMKSLNEENEFTKELLKEVKYGFEFVLQKLIRIDTYLRNVENYNNSCEIDDFIDFGHAHINGEYIKDFCFALVEFYFRDFCKKISVLLPFTDAIESIDRFRALLYGRDYSFDIEFFTTYMDIAMKHWSGKVLDSVRSLAFGHFLFPYPLPLPPEFEAMRRRIEKQRKERQERGSLDIEERFVPLEEDDKFFEDELIEFLESRYGIDEEELIEERSNGHVPFGGLQERDLENQENEHPVAEPIEIDNPGEGDDQQISDSSSCPDQPMAKKQMTSVEHETNRQTPVEVVPPVIQTPVEVPPAVQTPNPQQNQQPEGRTYRIRLGELSGDAVVRCQRNRTVLRGRENFIRRVDFASVKVTFAKYMYRFMVASKMDFYDRNALASAFNKGLSFLSDFESCLITGALFRLVTMLVKFSIMPIIVNYELELSHSKVDDYLTSKGTNSVLQRDIKAWGHFRITKSEVITMYIERMSNLVQNCLLQFILCCTDVFGSLITNLPRYSNVGINYVLRMFVLFVSNANFLNEFVTVFPFMIHFSHQFVTSLRTYAITGEPPSESFDMEELEDKCDKRLYKMIDEELFVFDVVKKNFKVSMPKLALFKMQDYVSLHSTSFVQQSFQKILSNMLDDLAKSVSRNPILLVHHFKIFRGFMVGYLPKSISDFLVNISIDLIYNVIIFEVFRLFEEINYKFTKELFLKIRNILLAISLTINEIVPKETRKSFANEKKFVNFMKLFNMEHDSINRSLFTASENAKIVKLLRNLRNL